MPITVERYGNIIHHHINDTEEVGYYHDVKHGCSVMVQRSKGQQQDFEFFGTIHIGSKSYLIQPPDDTQDTHSLTEIHRTKHAKGDYVQSRLRKDIIQNVDRPKDIVKQRHRRQNIVYEIEVLMVVDFSVYSFWRKRLSGTASALLDIKAKKNLRHYYALLLHSTDLYYKSVTGRGYEIKLLFVGLHVSDKISTSSWTEPLKNVSTSPVSIDSSVALETFSNWASAHEKQLPSFDHALLFTRYEMQYNKNGIALVDGLGYVGGLCDKDRVSLIQEDLDVNTAHSAARELAHNLGAYHDGEGNSCSDSDGYIMAAPSPFYMNNSVNLRFWKFSSCSLDYFGAFIKNLTTRHNNCMTTGSAAFNASALSEYSNELLGQVYFPDEQCHFLYGDDSKMCRAFYDGDYKSICDKMNCDANSTSCWNDIPFDGIVCGNGKMCRKGKCITSPDAPTGLSDSCPHGDKPGILPYLNRPCIDIRSMKSLHYQCYDKYYSIRCCETCDIVSKLYNMPACEFGDRHPTCDVSECATYDDNSRNHICCSSCSKSPMPVIIYILASNNWLSI